MSNFILVPREVLQKAYDALEGAEGRFDVGSETYILAEQLDVLLHPDKAGLSPKTLFIEGAMSDAYEAGYRPDGFGGAPLRGGQR